MKMRLKKLPQKSEYVLCKVHHHAIYTNLHDKDVGDMNEWIIAVELRSNYELPFRRINTYFAHICTYFCNFFQNL